MAEKDVVITFESLFELLRREKFRTELQKLDGDFFSSVIGYLKAKDDIAKSQQSNKSIFSSESEKTKVQLKNSKRMIKDIYERRESKLLQNALLFSRSGDSSLAQPTMLPEEQALFEELSAVLKKHRCNILENVLNMNPTKKPKALKRGGSCKKTNLVCFTEAVPELVGPDLKSYGPYKKGDKAELPDEMKEMLVSSKQAEIVEK